ncbi:hypothetical protein [Bradyrhizobium liaoningense]|uniref:hypothetical protein n=1 Tax=Bradyrhizobium liaoningense TaxID=43992 RepID=UPI001BA4A0FD|nr:hypothetical protein [Bradyrhizobium liaoningense]MBR0712702.1 hypothetical protein [Bradyrhizobium liaoningense]
MKSIVLPWEAPPANEIAQLHAELQVNNVLALAGIAQIRYAKKGRVAFRNREGREWIVSDRYEAVQTRFDLAIEKYRQVLDRDAIARVVDRGIAATPGVKLGAKRGPYKKEPKA